MFLHIITVNTSNKKITDVYKRNIRSQRKLNESNRTRLDKIIHKIVTMQINNGT